MTTMTLVAVSLAFEAAMVLDDVDDVGGSEGSGSGERANAVHVRASAATVAARTVTLG